MFGDFRCQRCDGQSVVLPEDFDDTSHVTCRTCGALQGTLADLRLKIAAAQTRRDRVAGFTGC